MAAAAHQLGLCFKIGACMFSVAPLSVWASPPPSSLICGGAQEHRLWRLWDSGARRAIRTQLIEQRLLRDGDTYALYDLQINLGNLVAMADRCRRPERLAQLADLLLPAFGSLESLPPPDEHHQGWVCRGGSLCTVQNLRLGREVPLVSLQGLGLFTDLAVRLAGQPEPTLQQHPFVHRTAVAAQAHLERLSTPARQASLLRRLHSSPAQANSSSQLLFDSSDIWLYTVALNTSVISPRSWRPSKSVGDMVQAVALLFQQRTTFDRKAPLLRASLDEGFWTHYPDSSYSAYEGPLSPVVCLDVAGRLQPVLRKPPIQPQSAANVGWDISHSRRLVSLFEAVNRYRSRALNRFGLSLNRLPSAQLQRAYANQLVDQIWNQDLRYPLFTNFWSGANGWYRVAYKPGNQACRLGNAPYSLSSSFAQGGFITWGRMQPRIMPVAWSLYKASLSLDPGDQAWLANHYPELSVADDAPAGRQFGKIQFLASLISTDR
jgi:hypothetical protein